VEICGALIGQLTDARVEVVGAVPGEGASHGGAHVTFTQEAWVRIHEERADRFPGQRIVGWYHSHPGFGVFLSEHDTFIHKNFFTGPGNLAWVYDPLSEEEGCFGWSRGQIRRLTHFSVVSDADDSAGVLKEPEADSPYSVVVRDEPRQEAVPVRRFRRIFIAVVLVLAIAAGWFVLTRTSIHEKLNEALSTLGRLLAWLKSKIH